MTNERLIANAGSGKTHALTTRMIQLLALDVEPRKIAALTFTRKSAGEFLSAVFERLAEAALDPRKLEALQAHTGLAGLDAAGCRRLLGRLADQLGLLGMGTIDSLFARIARAFPLESGLAEDFSMAGEAQIQAARERTLAALFATESEASLSGFIDLLRRANRNHGERDMFQILLRESGNLHAKFLATPAKAVWGDAAVIWAPAGCPILKAGSPAPVARALWREIQHQHPQLSESAFTAWKAGLELAASHPYPKPFSEDLKKFFGKLSGDRADNDGTVYIPTGNGRASRVVLTPPIRKLRDELRHAMLRPGFESLLERSRSLHTLMQKFEAHYADRVRSAGIVTFGDITDALARQAGNLAWRGIAGYRIDQTFDHWLIDEFQDTSRPQWSILKAFIDEVVMDPEGRRSFFYVGDIKQAIYSWRGGDPDLFGDVFDHYNQNAPAIRDASPLVESYRSCAPILDFVNRVFGDLASACGKLEIPEATLAKWSSAWRTHTTSPKTCDLPGYALWHAVPKEDGDEEAEGDIRERKILEILHATRPWERGISCAVLQRDNKGVESLAALLLSKGIPVAVEGKTNPCVDNPLGVALLAALRLCASPDDQLSATLLRGSPAAAGWGFEGQPGFRKNTLSKLASEGFAATIRTWVNRAPLDGEPFLQERANAFLLAAEEFDALRNSADGIPDFLRFVESRQTQENEAADVVRIMTIHQSKGLGFDMVIASGLDQRTRGNDGVRLALGPTADKVQWGLELPAKEISALDEVLQRLVDADAADDKFAEICTAYVALTRPKKALYVITTALSEKTTAKNFARLLGLRFEGTTPEFGDSHWFEAHARITPASATAEQSLPFHAPLRGTPKPVSPSSLKDSTSPVGGGRGGMTSDAATLGIEVHEALARIEWSGNLPALPESLSPEAARRIRQFLAQPIAHEVFTRPADPHDLWREQAFDVMLDGKWVSGIFDRVVVLRTPEGLARSATIYDFKTDHGLVSEIERRHASQMDTYRQAVSQLLRLSPDRVTSRLVLLR